MAAVRGRPGEGSAARAGQCGVCGRPVHRAGLDVGAPGRAGASAGLRRVGISWAEAGERTGWARREKRRAAWAAGEGEGDGPWGREGVAGPAWGGGMGCCAEVWARRERENSRPGWVALGFGFSISFFFPFLFSYFKHYSNIIEFKYKFEFNPSTQTKKKRCSSMNATNIFNPMINFNYLWNKN